MEFSVADLIYVFNIDKVILISPRIVQYNALICHLPICQLNHWKVGFSPKLLLEDDKL